MYVCIYIYIYIYEYITFISFCIIYTYITFYHALCRYRAYKARKQLAAVDWNYHVNLPQATGKSGDALVTRKYNPRTRQWDKKIIKVEKGYEYIPLLMAKIIQRRQQDFLGVTQHVSLNESDPGKIAPTTAHVPAPTTKEIAQRQSKFEKKD